MRLGGFFFVSFKMLSMMLQVYTGKREENMLCKTNKDSRPVLLCFYSMHLCRSTPSLNLISNRHLWPPTMWHP